MTILVDSHCHLDKLELSDALSLKDVIDTAHQQNIQYLLTVAVDDRDHDKLKDIAHTFKNVYFSVGLHPNDEPNRIVTADYLVNLSKDNKCVAIGETGLDYFRSEGDITWQKDRFIAHIEAGRSTQKPLIIHTRQAREDTLDMIKQERVGDVGAVIHCFTEDWPTAQKFLDENLYISFSGIVTFKNAKDIQEAALKVPLNRMLIETDSPYLAPMPHRGKSNYPYHVRHVAEFIANLRNTTIEEIAHHTTNNFLELFKIPQ